MNEALTNLRRSFLRHQVKVRNYREKQMTDAQGYLPESKPKPTIEECRGLAAQAWCTGGTMYTPMDVVLAEAFAQILFRELNK